MPSLNDFVNFITEQLLPLLNWRPVPWFFSLKQIATISIAVTGAMAVFHFLFGGRDTE